MFEFWLKNQMKGTSMMLPVTPDGYENSFGREIETVRATDKGDINVLGKTKPQSPSISGFFPENEYSFCRSSGISANTAMDYVETLKAWMDDGDIVRVVVADDKGAKINEQFYIESIDYSSKYEDNGDIPFTIRFRQYVPLNVLTVQKSSTANAARKDTSTAKAKAKTYTVKKGDSLSAISRKMYGDASKWKKIYEANKGVIGKNPNLIYPGQKYTIP